MNEAFEKFSRRVTYYARQPSVFIGYCVLVLAWLALGPVMGFENPLWHLIANSPTTIVTCGLGFLLLAGQARDIAEQKATEKEIAEDLPEVRHERIEQRVEEELKK